MTYQPGQVKVIFPFVTNESLFVLAGPADGDEAQVFHEAFPKVQILGFEPNRKSFEYQIANKFPGTLSRAALWSEEGEHDFTIRGEEERSSRLVSRFPPAYKVPTVTLDSVLQDAGPAIVWMDIERSEIEALRGAAKTFRKISLLYLEVMLGCEAELLALVKSYGFCERAKYNQAKDHYDGLFSR